MLVCNGGRFGARRAAVDAEASVARDSMGGVFLATAIDNKTGIYKPINFRLWKVHKLPRKARSSVAAETQIVNEGTEMGELMRTIVAEIRLGRKLDVRYDRDWISSVQMRGTTDAKDLYDLYHAVGKRPRARCWRAHRYGWP